MLDGQVCKRSVDVNRSILQPASSEQAKYDRLELGARAAPKERAKAVAGARKPVKGASTAERGTPKRGARVRSLLSVELGILTKIGC